ncbi:LysE family translocator [Actinoplanes sp. CA-054009]
MDLTTAALSFAAVCALLTITPGLDTALVLRSAVNGGRRPAFFTAAGAPSQSARSALARGALTNLLNPKVGAFYLAVLPQFIPAGAGHLTAGLLLASVHAAESMLWFTALILAAAALHRFLRTRRAQRAVDAGTGAALIGFGLKLGLSR